MASRWCVLVHRSYNAYLSKSQQFHVLQARWYADSAIRLGQLRSQQDRHPDSLNAEGAADEDITSALTDDDRKRIHQLFDAHMNVGTIAKQTAQRPLIIWKYLYDSGMLSSQPPRRLGGMWTDDEHVKLAKLLHSGVSKKDIAAHLGRSLDSVKKYISDGTRWRGEDIYSLEDRASARQLRQGGMSPIEISQHLGWPVLAIRHMLRKKAVHPAPSWEQVKSVFDLKETGTSFVKIAEDLGTEFSVGRCMMVYFSRMYAKKPSEPKKRIPWTEGERQELLRLRNDMRLTYLEIAKLLPSRSARTIRNMYESLDGSVVGLETKRYSAEERATLVKLRAAGLSWNDVAAQLPGRSLENVKNAYYTNLRGRYTIHEDGSVQWRDTHQEHPEVKPDSAGLPGKNLASTPDANARYSSVSV